MSRPIRSLCLYGFNRHAPSLSRTVGKLIIESAVLCVLGYFIVVLVFS